MPFEPDNNFGKADLQIEWLMLSMFLKIGVTKCKLGLSISKDSQKMNFQWLINTRMTLIWLVLDFTLDFLKTILRVAK